jgi:hypothetical protein
LLLFGDVGGKILSSSSGVATIVLEREPGAQLLNNGGPVTPLINGDQDLNLNSNDTEEKEEDANGIDATDLSAGIDAACSNDDDITLIFDSSGQIRPTVLGLIKYSSAKIER